MMQPPPSPAPFLQCLPSSVQTHETVDLSDLSHRSDLCDPRLDSRFDGPALVRRRGPEELVDSFQHHFTQTQRVNWRKVKSSQALQQLAELYWRESLPYSGNVCRLLSCLPRSRRHYVLLHQPAGYSVTSCGLGVLQCGSGVNAAGTRGRNKAGV